MDELISEFAAKLREIYKKQTAGDFTFEGVLAEFARRESELVIAERIKNLEKAH